MATKLDTEKAIFLGATAVREDTTFGAIRKAVSELDKGEGVSYADLEKHMLENFKPAKSENYNSAYVKAYVRDAVNKFGHLSHENLGNKYEVVAPVVKEAKEAAPKKPTKAEIAKLDVLSVIRNVGEVADESDLDSTKVTAATIMETTKKKQKTIDGIIAALSTDGLVRTEAVDDSTYVFLTPTGYSFVQEHAPVVEGDSAEAAAAAEPNTAEANESAEDADDAEA
jgi:hypothetical protein